MGYALTGVAICSASPAPARRLREWPTPRTVSVMTTTEEVHAPIRSIDIVAGRYDAHVAGAYPADQLPGPDDYVAYWSNEHGEELVFIAKPGQPTAILMHSDLDWGPVPVVGGLVHQFNLSREELAFLSICWTTSQYLRHGPADEAVYDTETPEERVARHVAMGTAIENEPTTYLSLDAITGYGTCARCGHRIGQSPAGTWWHMRADGRLGTRGCRAASPDRLGGRWDDTLPRTWSAEPA